MSCCKLVKAKVLTKERIACLFFFSGLETISKNHFEFDVNIFQDKDGEEKRDFYAEKTDISTL